MRESAATVAIDGHEEPGATPRRTTSVLTPSPRTEDGCGEIRLRRLGGLQMAHCVMSSGSVSIRRSGARSGRVALILPVQGEAIVEQNTRRTVVRTGDLVLVDGRRPYRLTMAGPITFAALQAEHHMLGLLTTTTDHLSAQNWPATGGLWALAADMFASVSGNLAEIDNAECEALGVTMISLITGLLIDRLRTSSANPAVTRQILLLRMLTRIRELLGDATLTPTRVANELSISLRHVQALFSDLGTSPAKWIRDERLTRLHADLVNPRFDNLTVAALGESWGLVGASQVSRLFRARYGLAPSEVRRKRSAWTCAETLHEIRMPMSDFDLQHLARTRTSGACAD